MALGFAYKNFSTKNLGIADYLDTFTIPLYSMFFIMAGTEIHFSGIGNFSFLILVLVYTVARIIGKVFGTRWGAKITNAPDNIKKYVGLGLLPQGGVALALSYTISKQFAEDPTIGVLVFNIILFTAIISEIFGPLLTKYALFKAGEAREMI
jgi:NhaP-type Na+/H+ or K+/H+ antiporter